MNLDEYERKVANEVIHPDDIQVTFTDIGGLDPIISSLRESVIYPFFIPTSSRLPHLSSAHPKASFFSDHRGVERPCSRKPLRKSLARLSSICRVRSDQQVGDHEVTGMMKAEFMTLWDGLLSGTDRIMVLGATNRPNDIDSAILRRMPKRFEQTDGLSGSDLRELCRNAAMVPVREFMRSSTANHDALVKGQLEGFDLRPLTVEDFFAHDGSSPLPPTMMIDHG
ncbi:hypothetical protein BJ912DRAFT_1141619 [Pholiota molesta]|nr:hypothetical protein BJ912DRAFT_1141619 [Pholiota molesta]